MSHDSLGDAIGTYKSSDPVPHGDRNVRPENRRYVGTRIAKDIYCVAEVVTIFLIGLAVGKIYVQGVLGVEQFLDAYASPMAIVALFAGILLQRAKLYDIDKLLDFIRSAPKAVGVVVASFAFSALAGVGFGIVDDYSRVWYGSWLVCSIISIWVMRALVARQLRVFFGRGILQQRVAVYGYGEALDRLLTSIRGRQSTAMIVGVYAPDEVCNRESSARYDGGLHDLIADAKHNEIDTVIVVLPSGADDELRGAYQKLSVLPAELKLLPAFGAQNIPIYGVSSLQGEQLIDVQRQSISEWGRVIKLVQDYVIASLALLFLSPLLLIVAIAIKLESKGPVFFRQDRHGMNNKIFSVYKFRTMTVQEAGNDFTQAKRKDQRVTRIGQFLRRSSIDELPQLINVLRGEMSIVGPRPHPVALNDSFAEIIPMFDRRHSIKPGITGWAQVNDYRGPIEGLDDMRNRVKYDIYYINNQSFLFDISIISATPFVSLVHKNAV